MLEITPERYKLAFARSMLHALARGARNFGYSEFAIVQGTVDYLQPPDDLLDFEYVLCTLTVNMESMRKHIQRGENYVPLKEHINKRYKDQSIITCVSLLCDYTGPFAA